MQLLEPLTQLLTAAPKKLIMECKLVFIVGILGLAFAVSRSPSDDLDTVIEDLRKSIANSQVCSGLIS